MVDSELQTTKWKHVGNWALDLNKLDSLISFANLKKTFGYHSSDVAVKSLYYYFIQIGCEAAGSPYESGSSHFKALDNPHMVVRYCKSLSARSHCRRKPKPIWVARPTCWYLDVSWKDRWGSFNVEIDVHQLCGSSENFAGRTIEMVNGTGVKQDTMLKNHECPSYIPANTRKKQNNTV